MIVKITPVNCKTKGLRVNIESSQTRMSVSITVLSTVQKQMLPQIILKRLDIKCKKNNNYGNNRILKLTPNPSNYIFKYWEIRREESIKK